MSNNDRISELYLGEIWDREEQLIARERVHWICSQVTGDSVIDLGCSQGIVSILLGREGKRVLGLDVNPAAISYAQKALSAESEAVQKLVSFQIADGTASSLSSDKVNSVIMGEVLEHQTHPERLLHSAQKALLPDGRVVITVPFGVHPDPDHKQTFYSSSLADLVSRYFKVLELNVAGKYLCCVAEHSPDLSTGVHIGGLDPATLLRGEESAFLERENRYLRSVHAHKQVAESKSKDLSKAQETIENLSTQLNQALFDGNEGKRQLGRQAESLKAMNGLQAQVEQAAGISKQVEQVHWTIQTLLRQRSAEMLSASDSVEGQDQGREFWMAEKAGSEVLAALPDFISGLVDRIVASLEIIQESKALVATISEERDSQKAAREAAERKLKSGQAALVEVQKKLDAALGEVRKRAGVERELTTAQSALKDARLGKARVDAELKKLRAALEKIEHEVRYKLGNAIVDAFYEPRRAIGLPGQMVNLFFEGYSKKRARLAKKAGKAARKKLSPKNSAAKAKPAAHTVAVVQKTAPAKPAPTKPAGTKAESRQMVTFDSFVAPERPPRRPDLRVATIMDEFTMECFRYECDLKPIGKSSWQEEIEQFKPHMLLVESTWQGNAKEWIYEVVNLEKRPQGELRKLVAWCREKGIPTVFWNKEDPINYELFIEAAGLFEYVFTTDEACIPRYKDDLGHDSVWALPFAAQPSVHNPAAKRGQYNHSDPVAFAGAWYQNRHEDRKRDMEVVLKPSMEYGLHIFDRYLSLNDERYAFPDIYQDAIVGTLAYPQMLSAYRNYKVFLNVNSVQESPTMFSRRVFELLACGTSVISAYALGIERMLGAELVPMVGEEKETRQWLDLLLKSPEYRERTAHQGYRKVLTEHTYERRMETVCRALKVREGERGSPKVSVVTSTMRPDNTEQLLENYSRQLHPNKELVVVVNSDDMSPDQVSSAAERMQLDHIRVLHMPAERSLGACLNRAIDLADGDYVAKFDDDDFYGPSYLSDQLLPFDFSDAAVVGKYTFYAYFPDRKLLVLRFPGCEHRNMDLVGGPTLVFRRDLFEQIKFPSKNRGEDTGFLKSCLEQGHKIYSADRYNFVQMRSSQSGDHSWNIDDNEYLSRCQVVAYTDDFQSHILV